MIKIGYFTTKYPYNSDYSDYLYGGSVLAAYYLSVEMAKLGHKIDIFTTSKDSSYSVERYSNLNIHRYGTNIKFLSSNISFDRLLKPKNHSLDIAHEHFDIPYGPFSGLRYARKRNVPLIVTYHGDWDAQYGSFTRRLGVAIHNKHLVDKLLSYAKLIISPSEYYVHKSIFLKKYTDKIQIIPNGINLIEYSNSESRELSREQLGLPVDKKLLLFVSFLSPFKGPDILLKAMPYVVKQHPNTELVFVGEGVMRNELEILAKKLEVDDCVRFVGFVNDYEKKLYYNSADIFILPSTLGTDVFPLVLLEASAVGLPIITSNLDTFKCIIGENYNGVFAQRDDELDLAKQIISLLDDENLRKKLGKNAREAVENYSWDRIANTTERIYEEILF